MIPINDLKRGFELFGDEYIDAATRVLKSGWYVLGNEVDLFEKEFADALSAEELYCAGVDNGLNAITLGLMAAGIGRGDEVIMQANGYIATMLGILHCGATPIFVEPDEYYQLDVTKIDKVITDKTKAVVLTHLYGQATRMQPVIELCQKRNLRIFEDCAQAHFASYDGKYAGTFGEAAFFSFYPTKNMGGFGDGGAVVSANKSIIEKVKILRNYGSDYRYHNIDIGYNMRLDEIQASLLRVKLKHIGELLKNRMHIAEKYNNEICNQRVRLPRIADKCNHTWYQYVVNVDNQERFIEYLKGNGIGADVMWRVPPYLQPAISEKFGYKYGDYPITEKICSSMVSLPMMDYMSDDEIEQVIETVNQYEG